MKSILYGCAVGLLMVACGSADQSQREDKTAIENARYDLSLKDKLDVFAPIAHPEADTDPVAKARVKLGQVLYFDKRLSKQGTISCNSCHNLNAFGVDNLPFSPGDAGVLGGRNSPSTLNAALHFKQFWDGRAVDVEEQAGMPILNPVEMAIPSEAFLVKRLSEIPEYKDLFARAFPDDAAITYANLKTAIGNFERKLLTPSRYDDYLKGDMQALSLQEKKGLSSFISTGCTSCHAGPVLGGNMMQKFGVHGNYWEYTGSEKVDLGLKEVTGKESDAYVFKVPSLRNIEKTAPYFHDGSVMDLQKAVVIMAKLQLNYDLDSQEAANIVAFLKALNGDVLPEYKTEQPL